MIPEASDQTGQPYQPPAFGDPPVQDGKRMGRKSRKWMLVAGAILVVLAVGAAGYFLLRFHKTTPPPAQSSNSSSQQPAVAPDTTADSTEQTYVSNGTDLNLGFTYPSAWNVSPPTNNNSGDQPITVTSPRVSLRSAAGAAVTGKIVVSIRPGSADISELGSSATAAQASVQFAYSK